MKQIRNIVLILTAALIMGGCQGVLASLGHFPDEPVAAREVVNNDGLSITLEFIGRPRLDGGSWDTMTRKPYVAAASRWLEVVKGVKGQPHHELTISVRVLPLFNANGSAAPDYASLVKVGDNWLPSRGDIVIASHVYDPDNFESVKAQQEEFVADILHEMGHILGIGSLWNLSLDQGEIFIDDKRPSLRHWVVKEHDQPVYRQPAATRAFNEAMQTKLDYLPISSDMGHIYDSVWLGNRERPDVPQATQELMANGTVLSAISAGFLDDLGWVIDYNKVDPYPASEAHPEEAGIEHRAEHQG